VFAEKRNHASIIRPDGVLDRWSGDIRNGLLLLDIEQNDRRRRAQQKTSRAAVEDIVGLNGAFDGLGDGIVEVPDFDVLGRLVEDRDSVPGDEECG
jgi:hypothetical protein